MFQALNPRGQRPAVALQPLAPRLAALAGRRIGLVHSWPSDSGFEPLLAAIAHRLPALGGGHAVTLRKPTAYSLDDPAFFAQVADGCDAFVYATAPSASTTHYGIHHAARLEARGRPGVVLVYETLQRDARNSVAGGGAPVRWVEVPYPLHAVPEPALGALAERVLAALVSPLQADEQATGIRPPPALPRTAVHGDYETVQEFFHQAGWTDGLPIAPPTPDAVARMLAGTRLAPDTVVAGQMGPEGWCATVEQVAVNAVMAGCTPACLPIVLAAVHAYGSGYRGLASAYSTPARATNSFSFLQIVNGPIARAAGMNGGLNALGPGNRANATVGRALRLALINLGGSEIGSNTLPVQGNPSAYTFACAENEAASPWPSRAQDEGFAPDASVLTLMVGGWSHVGNYIAEGLDRLAVDVAGLEYPSGIALLLSPPRARLLAAQGMDKQAVEEHVWRRAVLPAARFRSGNYWTTLIEPNIRLDDPARRLWPRELLDAPDDALVPVYPRSQVRAYVVGGEVSPMMQAWKMQYPVSVSVDRWR